MKNPKRYQDKPTPMMPEDSEPDWYEINQWCQRAKRKNKYRQLKHTITKLKKQLALHETQNLQHKIICHSPMQNKTQQ